MMRSFLKPYNYDTFQGVWKIILKTYDSTVKLSLMFTPSKIKLETTTRNGKNIINYIIKLKNYLENQ